MSDTILIAAMGTVIVAVVGVVWGLMRGEIAELKGRVISAEREVSQLKADNARSDERDKANEKGFEQLRKALADMDRQLGERISDLARVVADGLRVRYPGYRPTPSPRSYIGTPLPREEENDK